MHDGARVCCGVAVAGCGSRMENMHMEYGTLFGESCTLRKCGWCGLGLCAFMSTFMLHGAVAPAAPASDGVVTEEHFGRVE